MTRHLKFKCLRPLVTSVLLVSFLSTFPASTAIGEISSQTNRSTISATDSAYYAPELRPGFRAGDGESQGYIDYLIPLNFDNDPSNIWFLNPKVTIGSHGVAEQNGGLGFRQLLNEENNLFGANVYYDHRYTKYNNDFSQIGVGLEYFSVIGEPFKQLDLRVNGYFTLGDEESIGPGGLSDTHHFGPTTVLRNGFETFEEALPGVDYEVGVVVPWISDHIETRVYVGGYHYFGDVSEDINGFRGRIEVRPSPIFTLQLEMKYDDVNDDNYFVGGYFNLPFEIGNIFKGRSPFEGWEKRIRLGQPTRTLKQRMTEPVIRDIDIVTQLGKVQTVTDEIVVSDIIFVDNTNASTEDGTLQRPWNTLDEAFADPRYVTGATIFVFAGDSTATGQNGGYIMKDDTTLWGQGFERGFTGLFDPYGGISFPKIDGTGFFTAVEMGTNTELTGFLIDPATHGVHVSNESFVSIHNNIITGHINNGIQIINDDGGAHTDFAIFGNTITSNGSDGIYINNQGGSTFNNLSITNNTIVENGDNGIEIDNDDSSMTNFTISGNTISDNGSYGIDIYSSGNGFFNNFVFSGNTIMSNGSGGIYVGTDDTTTFNNFAFSGNTVTANDGDGFFFDISDDSTATNWTFTNNTVSDNSDDGFDLDVDDSSSANNFTFTNNNVMSNGGIGFEIDVTGSSDANNWTFTGNTVSGNSSEGIDIYLYYYTAANNWTFTGNTVNSNDGNGINIDVYYGSEANNWTFTGNTVSGNASDGIHAYIHGYYNYSSSANNWTFTGNTVSGNASDGIYAYLYSYAEGNNWAFTGNTVNDNGSDGVFAKINYYSSADNWQFTNNTTSGNVDNGVDVQVEDNSTADSWTFTGNTLSSNGNDGLNTYFRYAVSANSWFFSGNTANSNNGEGMRFGANAPGTAPLNINNWFFEGNTTNLNDGDGIQIRFNDDVSADSWSFTGNTSNSNSGDGIDLVANSYCSVNNWSFTGNTASSNGSHGVYAQITVVTSADNWVFTENTVDGNLSDGINAFVTGTTADNWLLTNNIIKNSGDDGLDIEGSYSNLSFISNSVFSNGGSDIENGSNLIPLPAEFNFWGGGDACAGAGCTDVDSIPFLTTDPN